ncbi:hypothetical protein [uncultured Cohaesibacter sp.]|uniref:hypothetical protein n=1 Tax=uncultured Cohaesibacter sp. TaxID=1002546 RepID=UPI00292DA823|nr:hypothetical protein [uncultured Cohaesibacter sp.]
MKHVISTEIEELIVTPIFESSLKRIDRLKLVYNSRLAEKFDAFLSENGEQERYEILKRIPINSYRSDFDRIKDNKIEEFVDNFRWNVLL